MEISQLEVNMYLTVIQVLRVDNYGYKLFIYQRHLFFFEYSGRSINCYIPKCVWGGWGLQYFNPPCLPSGRYGFPN